ncbi:MAG: P-II family nitrogen regulator [Chloroflexi bacterium]|nr:P-II family nitrogen regulator [Chloroflexota bacterium]
MKKIEAIIRRERLSPVRRALGAVGYPGLTVGEVRGHGRQKKRIWADEDLAEFLPKLKLEIVVHDAAVPAVLEAILGSANTGRMGDGKVFVSNVDMTVRVRTGETGEAAV